MNELSSVEWWVWLCLGMLLFFQSSALFLHARSKGRRAWLWGLWGMIQVPTPTLAYLIVQWWGSRERRRRDGDKKREGE
ncbi:hypothetical protein ACF3MZ_15920 [Paenibacillaceae bacterium WGS1546]|uniref:hypothetical protein n=1 Tax=Cohnella sp. WGS1546 TaxID=3366810 RepID=UPI00372D79B3